MAARGPSPQHQQQQQQQPLQQQQQQQPAGVAGAGAALQLPQYSLPPLTREQLWVQKRQAEEIQRDVRSLTGLDTNAPFANLQDAVLRLLPFHLFHAADPSAADLDETPDHAGADLMASRHEAWEELCMSKANDLRKRADSRNDSIAALESRVDREALSGSRPIDGYAQARMQQEDLRKKVAADKAELHKLLPPPAPVVAPPPAPAAQAAGAAGAGAQAGAGAAAAGKGAGVMQAAAAAAVAAQARAPAAGRGQQAAAPAVTNVQLQQQQMLLRSLQQQQVLHQLIQSGQLPANYLQMMQQQQLLQALAAQQQAQQGQQQAQAQAQQQAQAQAQQQQRR